MNKELYCDNYKELTGRNPENVICNIDNKYMHKYIEIIKKIDKIEICNDAYDVLGQKINNNFVICFKETFDLSLLQKFYKAVYEYDLNHMNTVDKFLNILYHYLK